jgi:transposase
MAGAVLAYRDQYIIERGCGRLKGKPLSVSPMYLERDDHATGLIRLLTIGLQVLTLLEFEVRRRLAEAGDTLAGIYPGNPKRATARPSAEMMLTAFDNITLSIIHLDGLTHFHITDLSPTQRRILGLLDFTPTLYTSLASDSSIPP